MPLRLYLSRTILALLLPLMAAAAAAPARIQVEDVWARATPPGATVGAVYMTLRNQGAADRLLRLTSPIAARVELHESRSEGGMMRMRRLPFVDVPAGGVLRAEPAGLHVMLLQLTAPLRAGDEFPLTLVFAAAGEVRVNCKVRSTP
jgi:periplasmic copper chaperone A